MQLPASPGAAVTIEGWDEDDDCTGDCCTEPARRPPDRPRLLARIRAVLRERPSFRRQTRPLPSAARGVNSPP